MRHERNCGCFGKSKKAAEKYWPHLEKIMNGNLKKRKEVLKNCSHCAINFIGECCKAVLCDIIPLSNETYVKLKPHKKDLLLLADNKVSIKKKRAQLLKQGGGFLSLILPALASALFGLLGNFVSKKVF
jgi:hypothetical protein